MHKMDMKLNFYGLLPLLLTTIIINTGCAKTMQVHRLPDNQFEGQATRIYVFRPSSMGSAINTNVYENNIIAGRISPRGYIAWDTKAGEIILEVEGGVSKQRILDFVKIEAKPRNIYYFKLQPKLSIHYTNRFSFVEISEQEAKKYLSKLKAPKVKVVS